MKKAPQHGAPHTHACRLKSTPTMGHVLHITTGWLLFLKNQRAWSPQELQKAATSSKPRVLDLKLRAVTLATAKGQESPHLRHSNCNIRPSSCHCSHLLTGAASHCCQTWREAKDGRLLHSTGLVPIHVINLDTGKPQPTCC